MGGACDRGGGACDRGGGECDRWEGADPYLCYISGGGKRRASP